MRSRGRSDIHRRGQTPSGYGAGHALQVSSKAFFVDDKKSIERLVPLFFVSCLLPRCYFLIAHSNNGGFAPTFFDNWENEPVHLGGCASGSVFASLCVCKNVFFVWYTSASLTLRQREGLFAKNDDNNLRILRRGAQTGCVEAFCALERSVAIFYVL